MATQVRGTYPAVIEPQPKTLVVHCADARLRRAFRLFIEGEVASGGLGLRESDYVNLIIPGGAATLMDTHASPEAYAFSMQQIEFLLEHFPSITTVIVVNHEDCAAYKHICQVVGPAFLDGFSTLIERQRSDLISVALQVLQLGHAKAFQLFLARFTSAERTHVEFTEVSLQP